MPEKDTELILDVGQANEIKLAMRRHGWTNADVKRLCEGPILGGVLSIVRGTAKVKPIDHIVDLDAQPFIPNGLKIEVHVKGGQAKVEWRGDKFFVGDVEVELYLAKEQQNRKWTNGHVLREKLSKKLVLNACLLDHLEKHPELIPESWKGKAVFFWGTIYRHSDGGLGVRYLGWRGDGWVSRYYWLDRDWHSDSPAAVLASN